MPLLWIIDDAAVNRRAAAATAARVPGFVCEAFASGSEAVGEYQLRAAIAPERLPRIVLMDYYLEGERGDEVTRELRAIHTLAFSPVIVGYSSVASCSAAIVAAGGDVVVRKRVAADGTNPELRVYLDGFLRIAGPGGGAGSEHARA